jgi:hypothetical protein
VRVQRTFIFLHVLEHTMEEKEVLMISRYRLEKRRGIGSWEIELSKAMQRDQTWQKTDENQTDLSAYETKSSVKEPKRAGSDFKQI